MSYKNKNTMSPETKGVLLGAGAGVATAVALNEINERQQAKLTGVNGDCSSIPCKDRLVCYKNVCLASLPQGGCVTDSHCQIGQKCLNDMCIDTVSPEEKQKLQEQSKKSAIVIGIIVGTFILLLLVFVILGFQS